VPQVGHELRLEPADLAHRHVVDLALGACPDRHGLLGRRDRRVVLLLEQLDQASAPLQLAAGRRVEVGGERGERFQLTELREIEAQAARHALHRLGPAPHHPPGKPTYPR
jgi:hypothetical protein